jgi:hypothetical protein
MTKYVVQDENLLGYLIPEQPSIVGILAASVIRGSIYNWTDGTAVNRPEQQRPATRQDFADFRVCLPPGW